MARDRVAALSAETSEASDPSLAGPLDISKQPPLARTLVYTVRIVAALLAVLLFAAVAAGLWALPWQADGAVAIVTAGAWCAWLNAREDAR